MGRPAGDVRTEGRFANIQTTGALAVGIFNKYEYQYAINVEYVRRFGSSTTTQTVSASTLPMEGSFFFFTGV